MFRLTITTGALALCASMATAQCPTGIADSDDGIYVSFGDFSVRYDLRADGSVEELETYHEDGAGYRFISRQGAFVFDSWEMDRGRIVAGTREQTLYADGADSLPQLSPGVSWTGSTVRLREDGDQNVETMNVSVMPATRIAIGGCSYGAWPMVVTTTGSDGLGFRDELTYLADLGFALYHGGAEMGHTLDRAEAVQIATAPPVAPSASEPGSSDLLPPPPQTQPAPQPVPAK